MKTFINGVQKLEIGIPGVNGALPSKWVAIEDIAIGTVQHTTNNPQKTSIKAEDKYSPVLVLYTPGDADSIAFNLLQMSIDNLRQFATVEFDAINNRVSMLSKKLPIPLAIRITTNPQYGIKGIATYRNTTGLLSLKNPFTVNGTVELAISADILPYTTDLGNEAVWEIQIVKADGTIIDGRAITVNAGADQAVTIDHAALLATAAPAGTKTIVSQLWTLKSGPAGSSFSTPNALATNINGLVNGVYIATLSATDSDGIVTSDDVQISVSGL